MKIEINEEFAKAVSEASKFISPTNSSEIQKALKIEAESDYVYVTAYNGSAAFYQCKVKTDVEESGVACINAGILKDISQQYTKLDVQNENITASYGLLDNCKIDMRAHNISEFPLVPVVNGIDAVEINGSVFFESLRKSYYAGVDTDKGSVKLLSENGKLVFEAIDGYRAARIVADLTDKSNINIEKQVLPPVMLNQIINDKLLAKAENVKISCSGNKVIFETENVKIISPTVSVPSVDIKNLIQRENETLIFETDKLKEMIKKLNVITGQKDSIISKKPLVLSYEKGQDHVEFSYKSKSGSFHVCLKCKFENAVNSIKIGINPSYIDDAVNKVTSENINFGFHGALAPLFIMPNKEEHMESVHVVLPVRIVEAVAA